MAFLIRILKSLTLTSSGVFICVQISFAQGLTYQPTNPAFGGNPLNNGFLVGTAQIQNQFTGSGGGDGGGFPTIDFPDINIDLGPTTAGDDGEAGEDTTSDETPATQSPVAVQQVQ